MVWKEKKAVIHNAVVSIITTVPTALNSISWQSILEFANTWFTITAKESAHRLQTCFAFVIRWLFSRWYNAFRLKNQSSCHTLLRIHLPIPKYPISFLLHPRALSIDHCYDGRTKINPPHSSRSFTFRLAQRARFFSFAITSHNLWICSHSRLIFTYRMRNRETSSSMCPRSSL